MNSQEATIEALQNRINYLEAHLHLALQLLGEIEKDSLDFAQKLDWQSQSQVIDIVPTSKVQLPTFLNSRTWKQLHPEVTNLQTSRDRFVANAS